MLAAQSEFAALTRLPSSSRALANLSSSGTSHSRRATATAVRNVLPAGSSEKLVPRIPRGPWMPKDEEVTLGIGRPRNPVGEERHMHALGTRGVAITARGTNHSSFHPRWLVRVYHRFCQAPVPYRPVSTPSVERAATWRNSNDMINSLTSTTEVPQYEKSVEKRDELEPRAKQSQPAHSLYRSCIDASKGEDDHGHPESTP